jgi:hypothetical protein
MGVVGSKVGVAVVRVGNMIAPKSRRGSYLSNERFNFLRAQLFDPFEARSNFVESVAGSRTKFESRLKPRG